MSRIASLETFSDAHVAFVRLTTKSGEVGWGQTSTCNAEITATIFHRQVAPWVLGAETSGIGALVARIEEREHQVPGSDCPSGRWPRSCSLAHPRKRRRAW